MLTKEERNAIAERTRPFNGNSLCYSDIYRCLFGVEAPVDTSFEEDSEAMVTRILDLCDTSNMIELPLDKNGEAIHIHDVVYDNTGVEWEVNEFRFPFFGSCIYARTDDDYATFRPNELTHKKPVTIASLVGEIRRTLSQNTIMNKEATSKLWEITDQIEMLGDSDD